MLVATFSITKSQETKIGGGLGYSTGYKFFYMPGNGSGNFDTSVKGIYELTPPIYFSPSVTYFIPKITKVTQYDQTNTVSTMMFDVNGNYVFNTLDRFELYGLAGLDILLSWRKEISKLTDPITHEKTNYVMKERDNRLGLNLGVGTYMKITEQIDLYGEVKYIVSHYDQFMLNAGVLINIDWLKKNEKKSN